MGTSHQAWLPWLAPHTCCTCPAGSGSGRQQDAVNHHIGNPLHASVTVCITAMLHTRSTTPAFYACSMFCRLSCAGSDMCPCCCCPPPPSACRILREARLLLDKSLATIHGKAEVGRQPLHVHACAIRAICSACACLCHIQAQPGVLQQTAHPAGLCKAAPCPFSIMCVYKSNMYRRHIS